MATLKVRFIKEIHRKGDWALLAVTNLSNDDLPANMKVNGTCDRSEFSYGGEYTLHGSVTSHAKYGKGFRFSSFGENEPISRQAIVKYLINKGQGLGIGYKRAESIYELYGQQSLEVIREGKASVPGVSPERLSQLAERLNDVVDAEQTIAKLVGLLDGRGFAKNLPQQLWDRLAARAPAIVEANPYVLLSFGGCGFLGVDKLYLDRGGDPNGLHRQAWVARYEGLVKGSHGSTWVPGTELRQSIQQTVASPKVNDALSHAVEEKILGQRGDFYSLPTNSKHEARIAKFIDIAAAEPGDWPSIDHRFFTAAGLTEHQLNELEKSLSGGSIAMFHGRAGTGKTYSITPIVRWAMEEFGKMRVACVAPTGKAAVRINEVLSQQGIDIQAKTIHSILEPMQSGSKGWSFKRNEENPLEADLIIVDEDSMIDLFLMDSLMSARQPDTKMLFIGDPENQLPPVGNGAPARDMMLSNLPCGNLTEIVRNDGEAVRVCHSICDGIMPEFASKFDFAKGVNVAMKQCDTMEIESVISALCKLLKEKRPKDQNGIPIDPIMDVQVIVATNAIRKKLNIALQKTLNNEHPPEPGIIFRVNDKVVCTKNCSAKNNNRKTKVRICNGDFGRVIEIDKSKLVVEFSHPQRVVEFPRYSDDGANVTSLDLAYAATCHKMQGSSAKVIIVAAENSFGAEMVSDRNWWNTAISRLTLCGYIVGDPRAVKKQIRGSKIMERKTFLSEQIRDIDIESQNRSPAI